MQLYHVQHYMLATRVWELLYPNIKESVFFGSSEEFRIIISKCGFEVECNSVKLERYNFESVDKVIEWSIATMNVDPTSIDPDAIDNVKKEVTEPHFDWEKLELILEGS